MIVAGVVELVVVEFKVVGLVVGVVDGNYLMVVEVVEEDCSIASNPLRCVPSAMF